MGSTKKDLEIVYNLQWKNGSSHCDDKANIVGMYDIPATTLNWETFKSYLLKNSGATGDDVKVSYVSSDDKEFPIGSQLDFQIALYSFRQRARNGDIITLKLDRISDQSRMGRMKRLRRSAEPRVQEEKIQVIISENNAAPPAVHNDNPPDWFKKYMKGFKKEIVEEVAASVINHVSTMKPQSTMQFPCHHSRKSKVECCKRPRKVPLPLLKPDVNEKDVMKSLKMERKLDFKLEKLEQKTLKIKEKKLSLMRPNDGDNRSSKSRPIGLPLSDTELLMDASAVGQQESTIPHMFGGETYQQEWEIINTGDMQWNENTELRYAWGSEALKPFEKTVPCPKLQPGDKGTMTVYLEIPRKSGNYECYWHFYHEGRRFGHWLGCQVIVDPSPVKLIPSPKENVDIDEKEALTKSLINGNWSETPKKNTAENITHVDDNIALRFMEELRLQDVVNTSGEHVEDKKISNVDDDIPDLKNYDSAVNDSNSSSDSDNQSIVSLADSNSSVNSAPSDEFVVVPMPDCVTIKVEDDEEEKIENRDLCVKIEKVPLKENNNNTEQAIVVFEEMKKPVGEIKKEPFVDTVSICSNKNSAPGYAYVVINGEKLIVPKHLLHADYLATAEDAPSPTVVASASTPAVSPAPAILTSTPYTPSAPVLTPKQEKIESVILLENNTDDNSHQKEKDVQVLEQQNSNVTQSIYIPSERNSACSIDSRQSTIDLLSETPNYPHNRLFVFPLNCPGFEVVYPPNPNFESLPPELSESIASNQSTKATDGNPTTEHPYGVFYVNDWPHHEHLTPENPYSYNWRNSGSAYAYSHTHPHPPPFKFEPNPQQPRNVNDTFRGASPVDSGNPNSLNHRFSTYMKRRSFNHAKHCSGMRCQQPLYKFTQPARPLSNENAGPCYRHKYGVFPPAANSGRSTKSQSPLHTAPPNEGQNSSPIGNGDRSTMHILPDTLVNGAVNVASSAINTARSVLNLFSPSPPRQEQATWEDANWSTTDSPHKRALYTLAEMGFWDCNLNSTLLERYNYDLSRVVSELLQ